MKIFRLFVAFTLICFAVSPITQAVVPAPDGGYPNNNTAEGTAALFSLTTGADNTAVGLAALGLNLAGSDNTAIGTGALLNNTASQNTALGSVALLSNTGGLQNTADGAFALFSNVGGSHNTAVGANALFRNTGSSNTGVGDDALANTTSGQFNVAIGDSAGANSTGDNNIFIGTGSGNNITTASNVICISTSGENVSNTCYIANIFSATNAGGTAVFVNSDGQLHVNTSSKRFKEEIQPMDKASESLYALKPVSFRYKSEIDPAQIEQLGLVAEDVEKVNPDLVVRDKEGKPYSVRYEQVNAMLLNEFLKEHRKVESLEKAMAEQQKESAAMRAMLKEQAAQIQKVSAQLEVSKAAPQTVLNNQ